MVNCSIYTQQRNECDILIHEFGHTGNRPVILELHEIGTLLPGREGAITQGKHGFDFTGKPISGYFLE